MHVSKRLILCLFLVLSVYSGNRCVGQISVDGADFVTITGSAEKSKRGSSDVFSGAISVVSKKPLLAGALRAVCRRLVKDPDTKSIQLQLCKGVHLGKAYHTPIADKAVCIVHFDGRVEFVGPWKVSLAPIEKE